MPEINYHLKDNMQFMANVPDKFYDVAICDPEQGRKEHGGKNRSHFIKGKKGKKTFFEDNKYENLNWDNEPASKEYFDEVMRVSKQQIIFGVNYYNYQFGPGRIIWDKCNDGSDQSDAEIAYNSFTDRVDLFRFMWRGMMQGKNIKEGHIQQGNKALNQTRFHPTQKPWELYAWIIKKYLNPGMKIIDTHLGSGSIGIAITKLGCDLYLDGIEKEKSYYNDACDWLEKEKLIVKQQPKLQPVNAYQGQLFG